MKMNYLLTIILAFALGMQGCKPEAAPVTTPEEQTDEPGTDEPGTDEPGTDEPGTDEPGTDEPGTDEPQPSDGILRILAIGNSFSQDAVEQYLWNLFDAAGQKVIIGNMYIGGCTLETHYKNSVSDEGKYYYRKVVDGTKTETANTSLSQGLADEPWDIVTFQQASGSSGIASTYEPFLGDLITYVKGKTKSGVKFYFHETWSYAATSDHSEFPKYDRNQITMYNAIVDAVKTAMAAHPELVGVIPSGTAVQNGRTSWLGDSFNRDGYHLEVTYGRFTAACTWYETISGNDVRENPWHHENINDNQSAVAKAAAHAACLKPYEITELTEYKTPPVEDSAFEYPVQIDFGGGSTATPADWTRVASYSITAPVYLNNTQGKISSLSITALEGFSESYNGVGGEPDLPINIGSYSFVKGVWSDGLLLKGTKEKGDVGPAKVVISGFDSSLTYDFDLLAVRFNGSADARECEYTLTGASRSETKNIFPGLKTYTGEEEVSGYLVSFEAVAPSADGTVTVEILGKDTKKAADALINALVIKKHQ